MTSLAQQVKEAQEIVSQWHPDKQRRMTEDLEALRHNARIEDSSKNETQGTNK